MPRVGVVVVADRQRALGLARVVLGTFIPVVDVVFIQIAESPPRAVAPIAVLRLVADVGDGVGDIGRAIAQHDHDPHRLAPDVNRIGQRVVGRQDAAADVGVATRRDGFVGVGPELRLFGQLAIQPGVPVGEGNVLALARVPDAGRVDLHADPGVQGIDRRGFAAQQRAHTLATRANRRVSDALAVERHQHHAVAAHEVQALDEHARRVFHVLERLADQRREVEAIRVGEAGALPRRARQAIFARAIVHAVAVGIVPDEAVRHHDAVSLERAIAHIPRARVVTAASPPLAIVRL